MAGSSAPGRFNGNRDACRYFRWHLRGESRRPCGSRLSAATIRRTRWRARPKALPWALRVATKVHGTWAPMLPQADMHGVKKLFGFEQRVWNEGM